MGNRQAKLEPHEEMLGNRGDTARTQHADSPGWTRVSDLIRADDFDVGEGQLSSLSPELRKIASLLGRLARTSRSFLLYDSRNEAIKNFISQLLEGFVTVLEERGELILTVRPFEIWCENELVYQSEDREQSLAFRLYRDGVRMLRFRKGFHWEELSQLLQILSIRYTGIHQFEDDVVTLLWRADFRHLDVVAVEGFLSVDDAEDEADSSPEFQYREELFARQSRSRHGAQSKGGADGLQAPSVNEWLSVPAGTLESLREEMSDDHLSRDAFLLLARFHFHLRDPDARMTFAEVSHIFAEVRNHLLSTHDLTEYRRFIMQLWELSGERPPPWDPDRHAQVFDLLQSCGSHEMVLRLLRSVPAEQRILNQEMMDILDLICPDPPIHLADALTFEEELGTRAIARQLLERYAKDRPEFLLEQFGDAQGHVSCDLLRVLARVGGEETAAFVAVQCSHPDPLVREEAVVQLERMAYSATVGRALLDALERVDGERRGRIVGRMARSGDHRFEEHLRHYLENNAGQLSAEEAAEIGRAMGRVGGFGSVETWEGWLKPRGIFGKILPGGTVRQVAAASALSEIPGEKPAQLLRKALVASGPEVRSWVGSALAHQRSLPRRGKQ